MNGRNTRIVSIFAIICILIAVLSLGSCTQQREKADLSSATTLADLEGRTIAAQTGTFHLDALKTLSNVEVKEYEDFSKLLIALNSGAIDGYVAEEPTALSIVATEKGLNYIHYVNNDTGFAASDADTGIAVAFKTGSDMVAKVNPIIKGISTETRSALMGQIVIMSADSDNSLGEALALTSSNTNTSNGTLKIAMECNYAPFNWRQTTSVNGAVPIANMSNMYANGYDVQIAKYIAAELGMTLEIYAVEWDSLIPGLQAGTYDGIIAGMSPTVEREEEVDFTDCYYNSNLVVIYKESKVVESNFFANVIDILTKHYPLLFEGLAYTMIIALVGTIFGLIIGLLTGIIKTIPSSKNKALRILQKFINFLISCYVEIFRGTPMMVQSMVIFWGYAFMNNGATLPLIPAGIFIVSINTGAYMTEIVRGGIISVDKGQFEGAYSVGMTHWQAMINVIIPQVMRNILPSVSNEFVINIKDTSVLNVIGVMELYYMANTIQFMTYDIFETYLIICVMYFVMTFSITRILRFIEQKLAGSDTYTICGSQSNPDAEIHVTKAKEEFR